MVDKFCGGCCAAPDEHHHGADFFAPYVMRKADDCRILDCRVAVQTVFHFNGIDIVAAGDDHTLLQNVVCPASPRIPPPERSNPVISTTSIERSIPPVADWYRDPVKVFDELYFIGTNEHSAWALVSDDGILILDTLFDYATGESIVGGLSKLGFDPADIDIVESAPRFVSDSVVTIKQFHSRSSSITRTLCLSCSKSDLKMGYQYR